MSLRNYINAIHAITGDSAASALSVVGSLKVDQIHAGNPPRKADIVKRLRKAGKVAMAGDASNDVLAFRESDVGIALGASQRSGDENGGYGHLTLTYFRR